MARAVPSPAGSWSLSHLTVTFAYTHLLQPNSSRAQPSTRPTPGPLPSQTGSRIPESPPGILTTDKEVGDRRSVFLLTFSVALCLGRSWACLPESSVWPAVYPEKCTQEGQGLWHGKIGCLIPTDISLPQFTPASFALKTFFFSALDDKLRSMDAKGLL